MATAEHARPVARTGCSDHECHKQHQRDAARIRMLRAELDAARSAIDELEDEIARLEGPPM